MNRRDFHRLAVTIGWAAPRARSQGLRTTSPGRQGATQWYSRLPPGIHLDYHYPEWDPYLVSAANGREMIQKMADTGAELVVVFAKCHYGNCYYNTRVGHKHKNLGERDLLEEWVKEARRQKMTVLAYYSVDRDVWAGQQHPDWRMRDPQGRIVAEDRWPPEWAAMGFLCYNSPYLGHVKAQVKEILGYGVDGFHFDMLWFGHTGQVCYCDYCKAAFRKGYGTEIPVTPAWDAAWRNFLEFRYRSNERFCQELNDLVRGGHPEVSLMYNYHGTPPNSWQEGMLPVRHRLISDYGTGEGYPPRFGHTYASFMSCFLANLKPGSPWQGVTSRYTKGINDHTVRPLADMKAETMTYVAHGGMPLFVDTPNDDGNTLDPVAYERMGAVFRELKSKAQYFGQAPIKTVALYFSARTRDWYGRDDPQRYFRGFVGAHRLLAECHFPTAFLFDETVSLARLQEFPLVFLANAAVLTQREREFFIRYVEQGGTLFATHETSRFDENGAALGNFQLAELFGVRFSRKTEFAGNYVRLPEGPLSADIRPEWDFFVGGPHNIVSATTGTSYGELRLAFHDRGPRSHVGHAPHNSPWKAVGPAVVTHTLGKGRTAYLAFSPETAYLGDFPLPEHRIVIRNLIEWLLPERRVRVQAPLNVEAVVTEDTTSRRYIIHFIQCVGTREGHSVSSFQTLIQQTEEAWSYRAKVTFLYPVTAAMTLTSTPVVGDGQRTVEFETNEIHEVLQALY